MSVHPVDLEKVAPEGVGLYEAIIIAAQRARQINQEIRIELNQQLETLAQLTTTIEAEEEVDTGANPDQLRISLEFEKGPKATELAIQELQKGDVSWRYKESEVPQTEVPSDEDSE
jgi:DNA-directed RNA polymerase subunit K/omega